MVDAFVTIRGVRLTAEKSVVRSNVKVNSVQKKVEVKDNSGSFIKKGLGLCKKNDCWLNVTKVSHKFGNPGEANVRQKKSEGTPPSRGKPIQGPGGARRVLKRSEAPLPPAKGGNPLTGVRGASDKVDHESLVRSLSQGAVKKRVVGETQKLAEAARLTNLQSSVANSMAKNYAYWWSRFKVFCDQIDASVMPFSSETAGLFLSHLAETAPGLGGVTNARAALNFYHSVKFPDSVSPAAGKNVGAIMKGINRRFQKPT